MRLKVIRQATTTSNNSYIGFSHSNGIATVEHESQKGSAAVHIPYYSILPLQDNYSQYSARNEVTPIDVLSNTTDDTLDNFQLYIAAADDFQCGGWSGSPVLYSNSHYDNNYNPAYGPPPYLTKVTYIQRPSL